MQTKTDTITLAKDIDDGFLVATVTTERGYVSVTGSVYPARRAWELGNDAAIFWCGCLHDEIRAAFPQLGPIVDAHLRPVDEATTAVELIRELVPTSVELPDLKDSDEYDLTLDAGLRVSARLIDEPGYREGVGDHYQYEVVVTDESYVYETTYGGSVHDWRLGKISAREAALDTLHALVSIYQNETARGWIEDSCGEEWDDLPQAQRDALEAGERAYDAMEDALLANLDAIGG